MNQVVDGDVLTGTADVESYLSLLGGVHAGWVDVLGPPHDRVNETLDRDVVELEPNSVVDSIQRGDIGDGRLNHTIVNAQGFLTFILELVLVGQPTDERSHTLE